MVNIIILGGQYHNIGWSTWIRICNNFIGHEGHVKESDTNHPIEGVKVQLLFGENKQDTVELGIEPLLTDSIGYFEIAYNTGRPIQFSILFSKDGFSDLVISGDSVVNGSELKIYLETLER